MKRLLLCLPAVIALSVPPACAQDGRVPVKKQKCTSTPCGNTETGEDPQEQRVREASERSDKIRGGEDDRRRWSSVVLYSDSTQPAKLTMPVIKAAGLEMRLDPKLGQLSFNKPGVSQAFKIAAPKGDKRSVCPEYAVQVIEASAVHALVSMACFQTEYAPGHYHMGIDYYLYDEEAGVMRNIWAAAVRDKSARMPDAKPVPSLKVTPAGYRFDWSGVQPSDGKPATMVLHNSYVRSVAKTGDKFLLCTNLSAPKNTGVEDEMCEGGILPRVSEKNDR